jgi:hypothetical protein
VALSPFCFASFHPDAVTHPDPSRPPQTTSSALVQPQLIGVSDMFLLSLKNTRNQILLYHIHMCCAIQMYVYVYMYVNIYIYVWNSTTTKNYC